MWSVLVQQAKQWSRHAQNSTMTCSLYLYCSIAICHIFVWQCICFTLSTNTKHCVLIGKIGSIRILPYHLFMYSFSKRTLHMHVFVFTIHTSPFVWVRFILLMDREKKCHPNFEMRYYIIPCNLFFSCWMSILRTCDTTVEVVSYTISSTDKNPSLHVSMVAIEKWQHF